MAVLPYIRTELIHLSYMKLLFVLSRYPGVGGIESVTRVVIPELMNEGHIAEIVSFYQEGDMDLPGVQLHRMPEGEYDSSRNRSFLTELIHQGNYSLVVYQDCYGPTERCVIESSKKCNVPVVTFEHNTPLFVYNKKELQSWFTVMGFARRVLHPLLLFRERKRKRYLYDNSFRYVLLSDAFISDFKTLTKEPDTNHKIRVIHNPAIPCPKPVLDNKEKAVLCVCRLNPEKRVDMMLKIWKQISDRIPDWSFWIVGDGIERKKLERIVFSNSIPHVVFWGFQKAASFYEKASIFWMTSKYEGWGMTLVEAMQRGCVPIAMDTYSSLKDIIDNGENGLICPADDLYIFGEQTASLAKDIIKRRTMAQIGAEKTKIWQLENVRREWDALLKEVNNNTNKN